MGSPSAVRRLKEMRREHFSDFLFLMETKNSRDHVVSVMDWLGYDKVHVVDPVGLSGGLALYWKDMYTVEVLQSNSRLIDTKISKGTLSFFATFVYGDPVRSKREEVWERLTRLGLQRDEAWFLVGDFNEIMNNNEKLGGPARPEWSFYPFRNMTRGCRIKELPSSGNTLSWGGRRENVWVQCQLDRSFGNSSWFDMFPRAKTEYFEYMGLDHMPIITRFVGATGTFRGRFCYDKRWTCKPETDEIIKKHWNMEGVGADCSVTDRLFQCRRALSKWKRTANTNSYSLIQRLKWELEKESTKRYPSFQKLQQVKWDLANAFREEELYWKQKKQAKMAKCRIVSLIDKHGNEVFEEGSKGNVAVEYFMDMFSSSNPEGFEELLDGMSTRVTEGMNRALTAPISAAEIKRAAFKVQGDSAPGADGWTGIFFKRYWKIIGKDIISEVQGFFNSGTMPADWNHTQICLIPKTTNVNTMMNMRPISLCSVLYKIVSNILCSRLKCCLPKLVSETQGAFVSGRLISDNILIAHEIVHALRTNGKFNEEFIAVKTDMSKAYDRVEWDFLETLFTRMGFDAKWIQWVMTCVRLVSYSVLINGSAHGFIVPNRGIRQGDPLSPFLFILCAEALIHVLEQKQMQGWLTGLFISKADQNECEVLLHYGRASGQRINFSKSAITFGSKATKQRKIMVKTKLGILTEGGTGSYLGLPECFSGFKQALLAFIGDKLKKRLHGWYAKSLSMGRREILLKSVAIALPVYVKERSLGWRGKRCAKRNLRGAWVLKIWSSFNQALLAKQSWRMLNNPNSLIARFFKSRYFRTTTILECGSGSRPSYAWRSILYGRELLKQGLVKIIGDGKDTFVWLDKWIQDQHPRAPYRAQIFFDVGMKVAQLKDQHTGVWHVDMVKDIFPPLDAKMILKMKCTASHSDCSIWSYTKSGAYSVKSGYWLAQSLLSRYETPSEELKQSNLRKESLWKLRTVPKIKTFLWRMLSGALAIAGRLASQGLTVDLRCMVCGASPETIAHTIFGCQIARQAFALANIPVPQAGFLRVGGSWILRDEYGRVRYHARDALNGATTLVHAGLQVLKWVIEAIQIMHVEQVILEIDCAMVVQAINQPQDWPKHCFLLREIHGCLDSMSFWECKQVSITANKVARSIARSVTRDERLQLYMALGAPSWLQDILMNDER
ncbi:PREDICTED: uncharacterized protein LOC104759285 [Camelina sativa]|uniref:Uncharacterized protein LOC104759285 n=1 Tax=Camelina sativa TaxID=90675 RepID=A0ABM0X4J3_CAMSA|nr:PREDICTED: uncharacterized protein LOC104759285 [Camelina sativa]